MAIPNTFTNGTVADADEVNENFEECWGYPKILLNTTSASTTFTPNKADTRIVVWVTGVWEAPQTSGSNFTIIDLDIASVTKDTKTIKMYDQNSIDWDVPFMLMWSDVDLAAASTDIAVTTSGGSISNLKIIVMEYIK